MNIILLGKFCGRPTRVQIQSPLQLSMLATGLVMLIGAAMSLGFWLGDGSHQDAQLTRLENKIDLQHESISQIRVEAQGELEALASRVGGLQAHATRLNALGKKLVKIASLDSAEFDFSNNPALGGPAESNGGSQSDFDDLIDSISRELEDREQQLSVLENLLLSSHIKKEIQPAGRPVEGGWISSYYGKRTNPFNGKTEFHKGMDFAGKSGKKVMSVAGGVVTWSGPRYGYGKLVEINHGNGYVTRYGHNSDILVAVGEAVKKGSPISLMGSTGRSTGPHVHLEVIHHGKHINPSRFVLARE